MQTYTKRRQRLRPGESAALYWTDSRSYRMVQLAMPPAGREVSVRVCVMGAASYLQAICVARRPV